jgi:hypothetical protein
MPFKSKKQEAYFFANKGALEKKGVNVCLEHLSTRDSSHPMKGHPGYQGDDLDYVADIIRRVGSPRIRLLFDIYHVQVMHGDLIRRKGDQRERRRTPGCADGDRRHQQEYPGNERAASHRENTTTPPQKSATARFDSRRRAVLQVLESRWLLLVAVSVVVRNDDMDGLLGAVAENSHCVYAPVSVPGTLGAQLEAAVFRD